MPLASRTYSTRSLPVSVGLVLLTVLVLTTPPNAGAARSAAASAPRASSTSTRLVVDPASWLMPAGNTTPFVATWVNPDPDCILSPLWYRWSLAGNAAEGTLDPAVGADVNFTANSVVTGETTLAVRSAGVLLCGVQQSAIVATAEANVTVVAPIFIQNLSVGPDPVSVGATTFLHGALDGGVPPYSVRIEWGDGTESVVTLVSSGSFSVSHGYPAGNYVPEIVVGDSTGLLAEASAAGAVAVSDSLVVGITADETETDVGGTVRFVGTTLHDPAHSENGWNCSNEEAGGLAPADGTVEFFCSFLHVGTGEAFFDVLPPSPLASVNATVFVSVVPLPTLEAATTNLTTEVGQPSAAAFTIAGGVPPFRLEWAETGTPADGTLTVPTDGRVVLPVDPAIAGSLELNAQLTDADGFVTSTVTTRIEVNPALNDSIATGRTVSEDGIELALTGAITAGDPPFQWAVIPESVPPNDTSQTGSLASVGEFDWSGTYRTEGWTAVTVAVVDAAGGFADSTLNLETVVPLSGNLSTAAAPSAPPGTFDLDLSLSGGLPPYSLVVNASDGATWNRSLASDARVNWTFSAPSGGSLLLRVVASDGLGAALQWNETVVLPAGPSSPPAAPPPGPVLALVGVGGILTTAILAAGYCLLRRRRSRAAPVVAPDPVAVLRGIIEPADGADRTTVELLAEEAGIPLDRVRATIDRLIVAGSIRSDSGVDGEEVISWSADPPT
ncbi:MAG: hypothetical protein WA547_09165 [Thermoplasmata archaeon]